MVGGEGDWGEGSEEERGTGKEKKRKKRNVLFPKIHPIKK